MAEDTASKHTFTDSEVRAYVDHIADSLGDDEDVKKMLPIEPAQKLFEVVKDGVLMCKLVNKARKETINASKITLNIKNPHQAVENHNLAIAGAKQIGCHVVNIDCTDLMEGKEYLVLGLIWQIIKAKLMGKITLAKHPELVRLVEENEDLQTLLEMSPEQILLRWFNHHLKKAGFAKRITNFSTDIKDSTAYIVLMNQISNGKTDTTALDEPDVTRRAELMLASAEVLGCRKFVTAGDVVAGHPRLNLAFIAGLFNKHPGIALPSEDEFRVLRQQNSSLSDSLARTAAEKKLAEERVDELSKSSVAMSATLKSLTESLEASTSDCLRLRGDLESAHQSNTELKLQLDMEKSRAGTAEESLEATRAALELERSRAGAAEQSVEATRSELEQVRAKAAADASAFAARIAAIEAQLAGEQSARASESAQFSSEKERYDAEIARLLLDIAALKEEIERLRARIHDLEERIRMLEGEKSEIVEMLDQSKRASQLLQDDLSRRISLMEGMASLESKKNDDLNKDLEGHKMKMAKLRDMLDHLQRVAAKSNHYVAQLRMLYNAYSSSKQLCVGLYKNLAADDLEKNAKISGTLKRHGQKEPKPLYFVLKDNFLFVYKPAKKSEPSEILRVDDAMIERTTVPHQHICTIGLVYPEQTLYHVEAETAKELEAWFNALNDAAEFWADNKHKRNRTESHATPHRRESTFG